MEKQNKTKQFLILKRDLQFIRGTAYVSNYYKG